MKLADRIFVFLMVSVLVLSGSIVGLEQAAYADEAAGLHSDSDSQPQFIAQEEQTVFNPGEVGPKPRLLSSDGSEVSFSISVPWEQMSLEPVTFEGKDYARVLLPGWYETITPGLPALPFMVEQIGVPFGAHVSISVEPGKVHTQKLTAPVVPVATQQANEPSTSDPFQSPVGVETSMVYVEDPSVYMEGAVYPGILAELSGDGVLRQQRVAGIAAYPVQFDPKAMELTVYESLTIVVKFQGAELTGNNSLISDSPTYENLLRGELLNYESARNFRQADSPAVSETNLSGAAIPWAPPEPGWRISVQQDGFYELSYSELSGVDFLDTSPDPRTFQLYHMGEEVAIQVPGEEDGVFDENDTIRFFGQVISSKYTQDSVYWLTYDPLGVRQGKRMAFRDGTPGTATIPSYYSASRHMESNLYYFSLLPFEEETERWWWGAVQAPNTPSWTLPEFTLIAPDTDPAHGPAHLAISVIGYTNNLTIAPDHHMQVSINGVVVGDGYFDGREWQVFEFSVVQGILQPGTNSVVVSSIPITGVSSDWFFIDWVTIDYPNTFKTENDQLAFKFTDTGTWKFEVTGFSSDQVEVYDVSDPLNVVWMENISVVPEGEGFTAQFQDSVSALTKYWAMTNTTYGTVAAIEKDTASDLRSTTNGADHVIIAHDEFLAQAQALRDHRAASMRAEVVDVQDIYDQFGYGMVGADAIRDFLAYAYASWQAPAPSYVVLLGDGHYDPKDYTGYGRTSFIPPYLLPVDPWIGETASDNRYVTLVGEDTLPDMMIGRLAVNNVAEAAAFVTKIIDYEATPIAGDWKQTILAVADDADYAGDFAAISDNLLETYIAPPYTAEKVYYGLPPYTDVALARQAIVNGINAGKLIVNYIGHSGISAWGYPYLFKVSDVAGLTNGGKTPIMLDMTCNSGTFHYPNPPVDNYEGLGEVVTRADGKGAVANWSATGLGVASGHYFLNQGFFKSFFRDGLITVGAGTIAGKFKLWSIGGALDLLDTYTLFGDPALQIALEGNTNASPVISEGASTLVVMSEDGLPVAFDKTLHATDADGDTLTWSVSGTALHGMATALGTGNSVALGYVPDANYFGIDMFIVQVSDGSLADFITVNVTIEPVNDAPVAGDIPDQSVYIGQSFNTIILDFYVVDVDNADTGIAWSTSGTSNLSVNIVNRVATITAPVDWVGSETITFRATDPGNLWDEDEATFTVMPNEAPVVTDIPDQTIAQMASFATINLDDYVSDPDHTDLDMEWTVAGNWYLNVSIVDRVATITPPVFWTGSETLTFRATDPGGLWDEDSATFTVTAIDLEHIFLPIIFK